MNSGYHFWHRMKSDSLFKHAMVAFGLTLAAYGFLFACDMRVRTRRGGWDVVFVSKTNGFPAIVISQAALGLSNVTVFFQGDSVSALNSSAYPAKTDGRFSASSSASKGQPVAPTEQRWPDPLRNRVVFDKVLQPIPFGRRKFEDLTYLPGTLTFDFFGHELELMPRTMVANFQEIPWTNHGTVILTAAQKIPGLKDRNAKGLRK